MVTIRRCAFVIREHGTSNFIRCVLDDDHTCDHVLTVDREIERQSNG